MQNSGTRTLFPFIPGNTILPTLNGSGTPQIAPDGGQFTATIDGVLPNGSNAIPPQTFGIFSGPGNVTASFSQTSVLSVNSINLGGLDPELVTYTGTANVEWTRTITYEFIPIPEPASLTLLGLGGLALMRRRR